MAVIPILNQTDNKYTKDALLWHLLGMPIGSARCVRRAKYEGSYIARLPIENKVKIEKCFSKSEFGDKAYSEAVRWAIDLGCKKWGEEHFIRYMRHEIKCISHKFSTSSFKLSKVKTHYGVNYLGGGTYRAEYKTPEGGYKTKTFTYSIWGDASFDEAAYWVELNGVLDWGKVRWELIKTGRLRWVTSRNAGVNVNIRTSSYTTSDGHIVEYSSWCVSWREKPNEPERTKQFSPNQFGDMDSAGVAAHFFAAKKRAERTCSTLMLPSFLVERWAAGLK